MNTKGSAMTKTKNGFGKWLVVLLSCLMVCSLSSEAYAQRSSRGGGPSSKPSSRPASKPSTPTVSKLSTKAPDVKATPPTTKNNATSSGRNSSLTKPTKNAPKPTSTALSGETRPRPPPSTNATSSGRNASLSKPITSAPTMSAADKALYERAKQSGTVYTNREQATDSFKTKYVKEFTTKFQEEPKARPTYIPPSYSPTSNSPSYTVVYNQRYGGYGYWNN